MLAECTLVRQTVGIGRLRGKRGAAVGHGTGARSPMGLLRPCAWIALAVLARAGTGFAAGESGGIITYDGDCIIHTFTASGTLVPALGVTHAEILVVAGGGGGGGSNNARRAGGGGGAGEVVYEEALEVGGPVAVQVGTGGSGGGGNGVGASGGDSAYASLRAMGGGGGGSGNMEGLYGGSGGGGGGTNSARTIQGGDGSGAGGNLGGYGVQRKGGGGGGAGGPGGDAYGAKSGNGGDGRHFPQFPYANGGWFAGGGGGGAGIDNTAGEPGAGGGGHGGDPGMPGMPAVPNTGGGGGGAGGNSTGGAGGSGIVIVRYRAEKTSIRVYNDVSLSVGPGMGAPGQGHPPVADASAALDWESAAPPGEYNKIMVRIADGKLPEGLRLAVDTDRAAGPVTLDGIAQDFITGIGNEARSGQALVYTLDATDFGALAGGRATLSVEYTITAQDP